MRTFHNFQNQILNSNTHATFNLKFIFELIAFDVGCIAQLHNFIHFHALYVSLWYQVVPFFGT